MRVDERTERLIMRRLDGELTPDQERELNQVLLTSADARRLMIEYQQDDDLAQNVVADGIDGGWPADESAPSVPSWRTPSFWLPVTGGLAAAAVIVLVLLGPDRWNQDLSPQPSVPPAGQAASSDTPASPIRPTPQPTPAIHDLPHLGERHLDREVFGVMNEAGDSILLFEVNRMRTLRIPVTGDL